VRGPRTAAARRALSLYDTAARGDRFHTRLHWWTCPFPALEREVPVGGSVLEVGCGHGLLSTYLALSSPQRRVTGIDVDPHKVEQARAAAARLAPGEATVAFEATALDDLDGGATWDAVVVADVLYLVPEPARTAMLERMASLVAPDGVVVVKEVGRRPRWKCELSVAQERLATGALGMTTGATVEFAPIAALAAPLAGAGLAVTDRRVDRGYPYAHHLVVARRTTGGTR
jgi:2-polyprenyl-3-methyl-5-hydroxy-6-metoxy-1,4-benzoquinol methylase